MNDMTDRRTIKQILSMLVFQCPGRDPLTEIAKSARTEQEADELRNSMILFWLDQLRDLDADTLISATRDVCGAPGQWSPSVGDIRQRTVELAMGHLAPPKAGRAWKRVCDWAHGESVQLTDTEKAAVEAVGKKWELKHGENMTATRAHFFRIYDEIVQELVMTRRAHAETKQLAENNRPASQALPARTANRDDNSTPATKEEVKGFLSGLNGYEEEMWNERNEQREESCGNVVSNAD